MIKAGGTWISKVVLCGTALLMLLDFYKSKPWQGENPIKYDMSAYYAYLPAAFVHDDLRLRFVDPGNMGPFDWTYLAENGRVIKMTSGVAILQTPFFLAAHLVALAGGGTANGYSPSYFILIFLSSLIYAFLGLIMLRLWLRNFLDDWVVALSIIVVFWGTNLWYYSSSQGPMSHAYSFFLINSLLYFSHNFWDTPKTKTAIIIGLLLGMTVLIRPVNVLVGLIFFLYPMKNGIKLPDKVRILFCNRDKYLIYLGLTGIIPLLIQSIYWQYVTGDWLHYSYHGERFFWYDSKILEGLFSYRKGWLIWTPVMSLAILGFFLIKKVSNRKGWLWLYGVWFLLFCYITFSWWTWWYGGSFGCRPVIEYYGFLALPLGALITFSWQKSKVLFTGILLFISLAIGLNTFQTLQYRRALLHWDAMSEQAYWAIFLQRSYPPGYAEMLDFPDYEAAKEGKR